MGFVERLRYNYYRDCNANTGRYIEADPLKIVGGLNLYVYANASPEMYTDNLGRIPETTRKKDPHPGRGIVICDGNGNLVPDLELSEEAMKCYGQCELAHELIHVRDFLKANRGVCRKPIPYGMVVVENDKQEYNRTERNAYEVSEKCLRDLMEKHKDPCDKCGPIIKNAHKVHERYYNSYKNATE